MGKRGPQARPFWSQVEMGTGCWEWQDLRARGLVVACEKRPDNRDGYRIVEPEPVQVALFFAEDAR